MSSYIKKTQRTFTPLEAMQLAIEEGRKGAGFVSPNPLVGCVVLDRDGSLISKGFHRKYGSDHAEVDALKGLSEEIIQDSHVFVTLEPCAHEGRTPSCAKKIAKLKPLSVTYGITDPNPLVSGKGAGILRAAGIQVVEFQELRSELEELAEIFLHNMKTKQPFVALKVASSLDGQMALKSGESQWITNDKSRQYAHSLRGMYDAILVGRRTITLDNPSLNVRHPHFPGKSNKVVIFDPMGELSKSVRDLNLSKCHSPEDIFLVVSHYVPESSNSGFQWIRCPFTEDKGFDLELLLKQLFTRGICSLLLEGGAQVYQAFLTTNQVQRLYHFQAPILLGAQNGLPWTQGLSVSSMEKKVVLEKVRTLFFDNDILVTGIIHQLK